MDSASSLRVSEPELPALMSRVAFWTSGVSLHLVSPRLLSVAFRLLPCLWFPPFFALVFTSCSQMFLVSRRRSSLLGFSVPLEYPSDYCSCGTFLPCSFRRPFLFSSSFLFLFFFSLFICSRFQSWFSFPSPVLVAHVKQIFASY